MAVTDPGFINVDIQMRTNVSHIFAIGDIIGQIMLAHRAVYEAHVAAEVIAGERRGSKEPAAAGGEAEVALAAQWCGSSSPSWLLGQVGSLANTSLR